MEPRVAIVTADDYLRKVREPPVRSQKELERVCGQLGIDPKSHVRVYPDGRVEGDRRGVPCMIGSAHSEALPEQVRAILFMRAANLAKRVEPEPIELTLSEFLGRSLAFGPGTALGYLGLEADPIVEVCFHGAVRLRDRPEVVLRTARGKTEFLGAVESALAYQDTLERQEKTALMEVQQPADNAEPVEGPQVEEGKASVIPPPIQGVIFHEGEVSRESLNGTAPQEVAP